jgi:L-lactate utilization protein LutB
VKGRPDYLAQLESAVTARGGVVHWAPDAAEANRIVIDLVRGKRPLGMTRLVDRQVIDSARV